MSWELKLKNIERELVGKAVAGRTLARGVWEEVKPSERETVLHAYGLYRCELTMSRLVKDAGALLETIAIAARAAGGTAAELRARSGAPVPKGAPRFNRAIVERSGTAEELAARMSGAYAAARELLPKLAVSAKRAAGELVKFGCVPDYMGAQLASAFESVLVKQSPKRNYRWWLPETAHAALAAIETVQVARGLWKLKAEKLEKEIDGAAKGAGGELVGEWARRYRQARLEGESGFAELLGLREAIEAKGEGKGGRKP